MRSARSWAGGLRSGSSSRPERRSRFDASVLLEAGLAAAPIAGYEPPVHLFDAPALVVEDGRIPQLVQKDRVGGDRSVQGGDESRLSALIGEPAEVARNGGRPSCDAAFRHPDGSITPACASQGRRDLVHRGARVSWRR